LRSPPAHLQIFRERLKPDIETIYSETEERIARFCAERNCPNRYLALASLTLPRDVWWLNEFSSRAEMDGVTEFYARNQALTEAMQELAQGKAMLTEVPADLITSFRPDLSEGSDWRIGELRFAVIRRLPAAMPTAGQVFEAPDGSAFVFAAASTREEADRLAAALGDGATLFEVRPEWSYPSDDWVSRNPDLWRR
jgi:hypothetical protein